MTEKSKTTRTRGRPAYRPSIEDRKTVEQMKFCGESDNTIARALNIDPDTLRKHFADELADGHAQRRKEVIGLMFDAARSGNVAAIKKLEEMGRVAAASEAVNGRCPTLDSRGTAYCPWKRVSDMGKDSRVKVVSFNCKPRNRGK
jgi:hypothetical protein